MRLILYNTDAVLICAGFFLLQLLAHLDPLPMSVARPLRPSLSAFTKLELLLAGVVKNPRMQRCA